MSLINPFSVCIDKIFQGRSIKYKIHSIKNILIILVSILQGSDLGR